MAKEWTAARRKKFLTTVAAKRELKNLTTFGEISLDGIPDRVKASPKNKSQVKQPLSELRLHIIDKMLDIINKVLT